MAVIPGYMLTIVQTRALCSRLWLVTRQCHCLVFFPSLYFCHTYTYTYTHTHTHTHKQSAFTHLQTEPVTGAQGCCCSPEVCLCTLVCVCVCVCVCLGLGDCVGVYLHLSLCVVWRGSDGCVLCGGVVLGCGVGGQSG